MNKNLEHIKEMLRSAPKKGRKILYIGLTFLVVSITVFLFLRENGNYSCRISLKQKEFLKARIEQIADTGKVSEYMLYQHLKGRLKYETISKMPCSDFNAATEFLDNYEERIKSDK